MKQYMIAQVFAAIVAIVLIFVFYILLAMNMVSGQNFMTEMLLIVNAVILLAIFSVATKMEYYMRSKKRK